MVATPCRRCGALIFWDYFDKTRKGKPKPKDAHTKLHHTPTQCKLGQWDSKRSVSEVIDPMDITSQGYDEWNFDPLSSTPAY